MRFLPLFLMPQKDFPYRQETIYAYCTNVFNKKHFSKLLKNKKNVAFGAFLKDVRIGIIVVKADFGGVIFIHWLVVKEDYRGKGVGTLLLKQVEMWALKHKYHYAYLLTETDKNIAFYKKRGFRYVGKHLNSWLGEVEHEMGKSYREKPFPEAFKVKDT